MMRVLINEHGVAYEEAWTLVTGCFAYTNHTVMSRGAGDVVVRDDGGGAAVVGVACVCKG